MDEAVELSTEISRLIEERGGNVTLAHLERLDTIMRQAVEEQVHTLYSDLQTLESLVDGLFETLGQNFDFDIHDQQNQSKQRILAEICRFIQTTAKRVNLATSSKENRETLENNFCWNPSGETIIQQNRQHPADSELSDIRETLLTVDLPPSLSKGDTRNCVAWLAEKIRSFQRHEKFHHKDSADYDSDSDSISIHSGESTFSNLDKDSQQVFIINPKETDSKIACIYRHNNEPSFDSAKHRSLTASPKLETKHYRRDLKYSDKNDVVGRDVDWEVEKKALVGTIQQLTSQLRGSLPDLCRGNSTPVPEYIKQYTRNMHTVLEETFNDHDKVNFVLEEVFNCQHFILTSFQNNLPPALVGLLQAQLQIGNKALKHRTANGVHLLGRAVAVVHAYQHVCTHVLQQLENARISDQQEIDM